MTIEIPIVLLMAIALNAIVIYLVGFRACRSDKKRFGDSYVCLHIPVTVICCIAVTFVLGGIYHELL